MKHSGMVVIAASVADASVHDLIGCIAVVTPRRRSAARGVVGRELLVTAAGLNHPCFHDMLADVIPAFATSGVK